jgi:ATP-dependent protease ClpP protease subunit
MGIAMADRAYIIFHAAIDGQTSQQLIAAAAQLCAQGAGELCILISTPGGNVMSGITVYNALRALPCKLIMHNVGNIDSIGNAIFLAADKRIACAHSTFMFHGVGIPISETCQEKGARELLDGILSNQKRMGDIVAERTRISGAEIEVLFREARTKDAEAALAVGIIDEIADAVIPKNATVVSLVL